MPVLEVTWPVFCDTATRIADGAAAFWAAVDAEYPALAQATNMSGSYSEAVAWGESYDERAAEILTMVTKIATAAYNYTLILQDLGYTHAVAEHTATYGDSSPAPEAPTPPAIPVAVCRIPLPAAGGPGNGLVDSGLGLCEKIGITVPDGNATTVSNAADTWARIAAAPAVTGFLEILEAAAVAFDDQIAIELAFVDEDLRALKAAVSEVIAGASELSGSCQEFREALDEMRTLLREQLELIAEALLWELGTTAAIGFVGSFFTFGIAAGGAAAAAAVIAARYALPIRAMIEAWKTRRSIAAGVRMDADIARHVAEMERLEDLTPSGRLAPKPDPRPAPRPKLTDGDVAALRDYITDGANINTALWKGDHVDPQRIATINAALDKLPPYEGELVRRVTLTQDELARYIPNSKITEDAFTSSSPPGKNKFGGNVEFQILPSQNSNARQIEQYAEGHYKNEYEVLFKQPTTFTVHDKFYDEASGRWIVQMKEVGG